MQPNEILDPKVSLNKPTGTILAPHSPPASIPISSAPRGPVPKLPKERIPEPIDEPPVHSQEEWGVVREARVPIQESTSRLLAGAELWNAEVPSDVKLKPVPTKKPSLLAKYQSPALAEDSSLATEGSTLISWRSIDHPASPSPSNEDKELPSAAKNTMYAADAQVIIEEGISLKERMATFQGKGVSGPINLPPKPATKKPMWKPPPKPVNSPPLTEEKLPANTRAVIRTPLPQIESAGTPSTKPMEPTEQEGGRNGFNKGPEEEKHQQGAAFAARTEQLSWTEVGRTPPVVAPKPLIKRPGVLKEGKTKPGTYHIQ